MTNLFHREQCCQAPKRRLRLFEIRRRLGSRRRILKRTIRQRDPVRQVQRVSENPKLECPFGTESLELIGKRCQQPLKPPASVLPEAPHAQSHTCSAPRRAQLLEFS